ncbi:MAG: hypothetical protein BalsKO_24980 [Balneolaceae bacterium]
MTRFILLILISNYSIGCISTSYTPRKYIPINDFLTKNTTNIPLSNELIQTSDSQLIGKTFNTVHFSSTNQAHLNHRPYSPSSNFIISFKDSLSSIEFQVFNKNTLPVVSKFQAEDIEKGDYFFDLDAILPDSLLPDVYYLVFVVNEESILIKYILMK